VLTAHQPEKSDRADPQTIFQTPILGSANSELIGADWAWIFAHAQVAPALSNFQRLHIWGAGLDGPKAVSGAVAIRHQQWRLSFYRASPC
jgi:hypothetical protein